MAAHIPHDTQNNGTGRSILLGYYVGFLSELRGSPGEFSFFFSTRRRTRTTTVLHTTYKALGLVEEPRLDDIIYHVVIDSASPITMTPAGADRGTDTVYRSATTAFVYSLHYDRAYYLGCWCRDRSG